MANATASSVQSHFSSMVRNRANNGISWGTNRYPTDALSSWFGGTTSGISALPSTSALGSPGTMVPGKVRSVLLEQTRQYARIKRMRIRIRLRTTNGSKTSYPTKYDSTAIAHARNSDARTVRDPGPNGLDPNTTAHWLEIQHYVSALWNVYNEARGHTHTQSRDVCHNSCHNNCHGSRSRR